MFDYQTHRGAIDDVLSKDLFFIGGAIKSGTTWLQILLDGHPQIACKGEGHFTTFLAPNLRQALLKYGNSVNDKNKSIFKETDKFPLMRENHFKFLMTAAIGLLLAEYGSDNSVKVVGERTPDTVGHMKFLKELLPNAKLIHIIRDGRDAAISGWFHNQRISPEWAEDKFATLDRYADVFARYWVKQVESGRAFGREAPDDYMEIKYEDLHGGTDAAIERLLNFLGVDDDSESISRCRDAGNFEKLSGGRKQGEEDRSSHFRKGTIGDWRDHFDDKSQQVFEQHAGTLLREYGYQ